MSVFWCCVLWIVSLSLALAQHSKLIQVQVLHRHGDRAPIKNNPPLYPVNWLEAIGTPPSQLTGAGVTQAKQLGGWLRKRYIEDSSFVSPNFASSEILVKSSQFDRTIATANAVMSVMFDNASRIDDVSNHTQVKPVFVPVHNEPQKNDIWFLSGDICGSGGATVLENLQQTFQWQQKKQDSQEFVMWFQNVTGFQNIDFYSFASYYDPVFVMYSHRLLPRDIADRIDEIKSLADWVELTKFRALGKLSGGALLGKILTTFDKALNVSESSPKFIELSAHDSTIMSLAVTMELDSNPLFQIIPPYASAMVLELWGTESSNNKSFSDVRVVIHYRNGVNGSVSESVVNMTYTGFQTLATYRALSPAQWCEVCGSWNSVSNIPESCLRLQSSTSSSTTSQQPYLTLTVLFGTWSAVCTLLVLFVLRKQDNMKRKMKGNTDSRGPVEGSHTHVLLSGERV